jgi:hypothetical protein
MACTLNPESGMSSSPAQMPPLYADSVEWRLDFYSNSKDNTPLFEAATRGANPTG